ncbi:hypothetical protein FB45DRAFT_1104281 [Roridomyces roridus]|uniref:Uncharacterized protein n=1 Tax=Roridomyces roridus TaxID=1738132 RepID=A0AAD7BCV1_9AGAR|nr:hypothetical protein FB45DRAFT_1104281 [Roridomyces roridus]
MNLLHILSTALIYVGIASAALKNYTIQDDDPAVTYSQIPLVTCPPTTCSPTMANLFNGTATVTDGPITVSFTGSAVYVYLGASGPCFFTIDGVTAGTFPGSTLDELNQDERLVYSNTSLTDEEHRLAIYPGALVSLVAFDYVVYT